MTVSRQIAPTLWNWPFVNSQCHFLNLESTSAVRNYVADICSSVHSIGTFDNEERRLNARLARLYSATRLFFDNDPRTTY